MSETSIDIVSEFDHATISTSERKQVNKILKLRESHPDEVNILLEPEENYGVLLAHVPKSYIKIGPPRKVNYSDEQRAALAERMAAVREKKE